MRTESVSIIRTDEELSEALARIEVLIRSTSPDDDEIRLLGLVIHDLDSERMKSREPDPIDILRFVMTERRLSPADLTPYLGSEVRILEVLNRKHPLTVSMIRKLSKSLGLPVAALVGGRRHIAAA